ncbi:hypothetical protein BC939DRAFT_56691 [Gamsiella multidivaricata]|uniref:uncharacterized protein n=1 Tax=Gamsiella multidivaricata TaxID=101098 RepID=UPI00221F47FF|nr:uncharacterized protein BC939DRAFT_56691 [Gamsiella multidivaricata]KAI7816177.1 hypothetical protein BC939DRAFT_56691 [Gamsiella multidivaricata]
MSLGQVSTFLELLRDYCIPCALTSFAPFVTTLLAGQKRLGAVRVEPEEAPLIAQHSALAAPLPPTAAIPKMSVAGDTVASMRAGEAGPSDAGAVLPPPSNASTTPPETPPSFAASPSCLGSPPAYFGAVNPSNTAATDSTASNITTGLPSDMNPDTSPGPAEMAPTAPPPDDQSTINNEERTILLSEIEKITHTCQPQEGEACLTCHFKRYQRLCVDALLNTELKIAEIADVVSLIGIFVPSRPTERMKSVFSDEELEALIRSGEVTHEEWDSVEFDTLLPMKAVRVCSILFIFHARFVQAH